MDAPKEVAPQAPAPAFDRPLPEGAIVLPNGTVKLGYNPKIPCPHCKTGWINKIGGTERCKPCSLAARKAGAGSPRKTPKAKRPAKEAGKLPAKKTPQRVAAVAHRADFASPKARPAAPAINVSMDSLVEEMAQQLAAMITARAAQIVGLGPA